MPTTISINGYNLIEDPVSPGQAATDLTGDGGELLQNNMVRMAKTIGINSNIITSATYSILEYDNVILCNPSANQTLTLPTAVGVAGKRYAIKKITTSNYTITIDTVLSQTIDGSSSYVMRDTGEVLEVVSDGTNWRKVINYAGNIPVGGVIAWLKSFTNTPALPTGYVECNGQVLSDASSVYNGLTIPNLNGSGGSTKRFLRGSTTSGSTGGSETHFHSYSLSTITISYASGTNFASAISSSTGGTSSTTDIPPYYEVVWIIRIK